MLILTPFAWACGPQDIDIKADGTYELAFDQVITPIPPAEDH